LNPKDDGLKCHKLASAGPQAKKSASRSRQTDNHPNTHHSIFTGRVIFLTSNQRYQSMKGDLLHPETLLASMTRCSSCINNQQLNSVNAISAEYDTRLPTSKTKLKALKREK